MTVVRTCDRDVKGIRKGVSVDGEVSCGRCKGMWKSVTHVSMLKVYLTFTGEV